MSYSGLDAIDLDDPPDEMPPPPGVGATPIPSEIAIVTFPPIGDIFPSPLNPRRRFDDLEELAANIRTHRRPGDGGQPATGILQPLLTRLRTTPANERTSYEIVDGERRYRAALLAGETHLPVLVRELTDDEVLEIQLLSAIQRQDLTPLEEARGYRALIDSNRSKYSAAYIADRISRSERYVVDRMRLLDLIEPLQQLLAADRIGVGHAELLAKLKPEDQARAAMPGDPAAPTIRGGEPGGLWERRGRTLEFEDGDEEDAGADPYAGLKPVTLKELEAWVARHVRFDVEHAAATAPLEFGDTAIAIETAKAQPGRGKKVIAITEDYRLEDDAKDASERVYGRSAWKRADGTEGTSRGGSFGDEIIDSPTCEHSILGVVAVGPGYGTAFQVCIARDRCQVHWDREIREREKHQKATSTAATTRKAAKPEESWEDRQKRETAERDRALEAYKAIYPTMLAAIEKALPATLDAKVFGFLYQQLHHEKAPTVKPARFAATLVLRGVERNKPRDGWGVEHDFGRVLAIATAMGLDTKKFKKAYTDHQAAAVKAAAATTKAAPAKAAAKKTRKKR